MCGYVNTRCYECVSVCVNLFIVTVLYSKLWFVGLQGMFFQTRTNRTSALSPHLLDATSNFGTVCSCKNTIFTPPCFNNKKVHTQLLFLHIVAHYIETQKMPPSWLPFTFKHTDVYNVFQVNPVFIYTQSLCSLFSFSIML